jgi:hypothetical protein
MFSALTFGGIQGVSGEERQVVYPKDNGQALLNPDLGWNFPYFTDNGDNHYGGRSAPDDTLDWFPGCNCIYFRTGWGRIEPKEGQFNWDYTDKLAEKWIAKGKQVAFSWIIFSTIGSVPCTPAWVRDAGAKCWKFEYGPPCWVPYWDDPVFLAKLENFLKAAAERYDGKPYVQFIEIGSLGTWGEGHTWLGHADKFGPPISFETQKKHIDLWRKHFKKTQLLVNDDYGKAADEYAHKRGYGLIDCSIMVGGGKGYLSDAIAETIWRDEPVGIENEHYGYAAQKNTWGDGSKYFNALEDYHATYARIHWWPDEFLRGNGKELKGNKTLVDQMNRRMGYRLQLLEASWPKKVQTGNSARFDFRWRNGGVAPCYRGGHPALTVTDATSKVVATKVDEEFNVRSLGVGRPAEKAASVERKLEVALPAGLSAGEYGVWVSVGSKEGTPIYALPLSENHSSRRYLLGTLVVVQ